MHKYVPSLSPIDLVYSHLGIAYATSIGRFVGVVTLQDGKRSICLCHADMKYVCCPSPTQLTDAIEGKKKPPSRDETDNVTLEMVQMAETESEVENPL